MALPPATTACIPVQRATMVVDQVGLTPSSRRLSGAVLAVIYGILATGEKKKKGAGVYRDMKGKWHTIWPHAHNIVALAQ